MYRLIAPCMATLLLFFLAPGAHSGPAQDSPCASGLPLAGERPDSEYVAGEVLLYLRQDREDAASALRRASADRSTATGMADLDTIGARFGLQKIAATQASSLALLSFPREADLVPILQAYCQLDYFQVVSINRLYSTIVRPASWSQIKRGASLP